MPHITKQLGNEVGIQYQGVTDASSSVSQFPVNGLIVGKFRRGRYDKPMTINLRNIRALLGHDPKNIDYLAVLDALNDGVPSVQVLRIAYDDEQSNDGQTCIETNYTASRSWFINADVNQQDIYDYITVYLNGRLTDSYNLQSDDGVKIHLTSMQEGQRLRVCLPFEFSLEPEAW